MSGRCRRCNADISDYAGADVCTYCEEIKPARLIAIVGAFPEGPVIIVAGGPEADEAWIRRSAADWIERHPLAPHEELRILKDVT